MQIGPEDLKQKLVQLLQEQQEGAEGLRHGMVAFAEFIRDHINDLTPEAEVLVDKLWEVVKQEAEDIVEALPDTPEGRQLKRMYARIEGKHWSAAGLIGGLEAPPTERHPIVAAARPFFGTHLQSYLDLLWDVVQHTHQGPANAVRIAMFAIIADELLVAFHLAQRAYASQSLAHIRTVFEAYDLVELFTQHPEQADLWVSVDERTAWREFKPAIVRKKLGQEGRDPVYGFLSGIGSHVTWGTIRNRTAMVKPAAGEDRPQITLWIGGAPFAHNLVNAHVLCLHGLVVAIVKLAAVFGRFFNIEEASKVLERVAIEYTTIVQDHFVAWSKEQGLDTTEIEEFIREEVPAQLRRLTNLGG